MKYTTMLRKKLAYYKKPIIAKDLVDSIINATAPGYTISALCRYHLLSPLKKGKYYFNHESRETVDPYVVGHLYCEPGLYCFGGMGIYNKHRLTTQLANTYTIYSTVYRGPKIINTQHYVFKQVRESFFWGLEKLHIANDTVFIMSAERALIQMIIDGNSLEFVQEKPATIDTTKLFDLAQSHASKTILSRIHALVGQR